MIGQVIDNFKIIEELGRGGMGAVYKAVDTSLDRLVALKVMHPILTHDEHFLGRFKAEAKALGRLRHQHIVHIYAFRHHAEHLCIVMEFVEGGTISDLITRYGAIPWQKGAPILQQTLSAIAYAHDKKVIHRDIKPSNILLTEDGVAKVTDFGLAKIQDANALTIALTRTGITGGTLYYMSPEQVEGLPNVDQRGDLYSLGMTFYEMFAGTSPFRGLSSEFAILKAIDAHDFPPLNELNKEVPLPLVEIIMKAVEREPEDRYQTAQAMYDAVEAWLNAPSEPPIPEPPVATPAVLQDTFTQIAHFDDAPQQDSDTVDLLPRRDSSPTVSFYTPPPPQTRPEAQTIVDRAPAAGSTLAAGNEPGAKPRPKKRLFRSASLVAAVLLLGALVVYWLAKPSGVEPGETARVAIHTVPIAASVLVNGQPAGNTPLTDVEVAAGDLALSIEMDGYVSLDTVLAVASGDTSAFRFTLEAETLYVEPADTTKKNPDIALGSLTVTSNPTGATVYLNNRRRGQTPYRTDDLEAGGYRLVLRQAGHQDYETGVTIAPDRPQQITADLTALMGTLRIVVQPYGSLFINDVRKLTDRVSYDEAVPYGTYQVRAVHPTYGRWVKTVTLDRETRDVLFDFNQEFMVQVISSPPNAEIIVDGTATKKHTPARLTMRPGQHTFDVRKTGWDREGSPQVVTIEGERIENPIQFSLTEKQ